MKAAGRLVTRRARDRGTASIEMVGLVPMVVLIMLLALQVLTIAYTVHGASQAARDAARAYSLGESPEAAAAASVPGGVSLVSVTTFGPRHGVRVEVQAPPVFKLGDGRITREVTMP